MAFCIFITAITTNQLLYSITVSGATMKKKKAQVQNSVQGKLGEIIWWEIGIWELKGIRRNNG
jgi:hypothetical protein